MNQMNQMNQINQINLQKNKKVLYLFIYLFINFNFFFFYTTEIYPLTFQLAISILENITLLLKSGSIDPSEVCININ
jgi:hypothetical protein